MKLEFESAALKSLMRMPKKDGAELLAKLKTFAENPYSPHPWAKAFGAKRGRVRHGDWRAIYEINDGNALEVELGTRLSTRDTPGIIEESNDAYLIAGYTKEF